MVKIIFPCTISASVISLNKSKRNKDDFVSHRSSCFYLFCHYFFLSNDVHSVNIESNIFYFIIILTLEFFLSLTNSRASLMFNLHWTLWLYMVDSKGRFFFCIFDFSTMLWYKKILMAIVKNLHKRHYIVVYSYLINKRCSGRYFTLKILEPTSLSSILPTYRTEWKWNYN